LQREQKRLLHKMSGVFFATSIQVSCKKFSPLMQQRLICCEHVTTTGKCKLTWTERKCPEGNLKPSIGSLRLCASVTMQRDG
jgi:hypothetical protein